jgi:hypothetical protein
MSRFVLSGVWSVVLLAVSLAWFAAATRSEQAKARAEDNEEPVTPNPSVRLAQELRKVVRFGGFDDPKTTTAEALDQLAKRYPLSFTVNQEAFKAEKLNRVLELVIADPPIPERTGSLDTVLRSVIARIPVRCKAAYVIRGDTIEITTEKARQEEFYPKSANVPGARRWPLVVAEYDRQPLDHIFEELARQTGHSIVVDLHAAEMAKLRISNTFLNVPLDTVIRLLTDMADLKPVLIHNTFYITTEGRVERFRPGEPLIPSVP